MHVIASSFGMGREALCVARLVESGKLGRLDDEMDGHFGEMGTVAIR